MPEADITERSKHVDRRSTVEAILSASVEKLKAKGHPSTKYPPIYMPPKPLKQHIPSILRSLTTIVFTTLVGWRTYISSSSNHTGLLTIGVALLLLFIPLIICSFYHFEHVAILNFRGVQLINLGAFVNVVFGSGEFTAGFSSQELGTFAGTSLITIGTVIFTYSTFILGPWEFMIGTPLLSIGLLLRSCDTYLALFNEINDTENKLNIAAIPFFIIALGFVMKKSYQSMHLPILASSNFKFYGIILYGSGIVCNIVFSLTSSGKSGVVVSFASALTFWGTSIFLLDSARTKDHCDAVLEDRYPSTLYLVRHELGLHAANMTSLIGLVASFASMTSHLVSGSSTICDSNIIVEFVSTQLIAASFMILWFSSMRPSLSISRKKKEHEIKRVLMLEMIGTLLFASGLASFGVCELHRASFFKDIPINNSTLALEASRIITLIGATFFVVANIPMRAAPSPISLLNPRSWEGVFHPCNYVLLAAIWLLVGTALKIASLDALGSAAYVWAFALLLIHWCMAKHVWDSMNLAERPKQEGSTCDTSDGNCDIDISHSRDASGALPDIDDSIDVMISGGGISGLFLACILGKTGLRVTVVERRAESITDARFAVLNSSSMEYMEDILDSDILEELLCRAMPESTHYGSMLVSGIGHTNAAIWKTANSPARKVLMENLAKIDDWTESRTMGSRFSSALPVRVMQSHQEEVLKLQLERYANVDLRCGWLLKDFSIDEELGVSSTIVKVMEDANGKQLVDLEEGGPVEKFIHSKFIVGCDGPGSVVAKKIKFKFDGLLNLAKTRSLLVRAPGLYERVMQTVGNTHQYQVIRKNFGVAGIVAADPVKDLWNFLFLFGDKVQDAPVDQVASEFLGTNDFEVIQNRSWYWNFFVARNFRLKKRAFLVGDSAHSWPPFGGIGGNSAYGDAINLGWKLASACKNNDDSAELLLESYSVERRQHVLQTAMYVLRATPRPELLKLLISPIFDSRLLRPIIGAAWYYHNSGTHSGNHFSQSGVQLGIKLNYSPIIAREEVVLPDDPSCKYMPTIRAGARLPFLPLSDGTTLFSGIKSFGYTAIVIQPDALTTAHDLEAALAARGVDFSIVSIPSVVPSSYEGAHRTIADLLSREAIVVVRPDHIIAWRTDHHDAVGSDAIDAVASTITGVNSNKESLAEEYALSDDAKTMYNYHRWLTREFKYVQRPYKFMFPRSIPVMNSTKDYAIALAKAKKKGKDFTTTTKQGAEKIETMTQRDGIALHGDKFGGLSKSKASPIAKMLIVAKNREMRGECVYNFAVGNPTIEPPVSIRESLHSLAKATLEDNDGGRNQQGLFKYTHPAGHLPLRSHIANIVGSWQGIPSLNAEQVVVVPGAQSALVNVIESLTTKGDRILVQRPFYPDFDTIAGMWGCTTDTIDFVDGSFDLDVCSLEAIADEAGDRLRIILLCSPSNPTGKVHTNSIIEEVGKIALRHSKRFGRDVWVVMDHTYWRLSFGVEVPATFPVYDKTLIISSFSKDMNLAGERIGYVVVNPLCNKSAELVEYLTQNNTRLGNISPPSLIQHVLADVIKRQGALPTHVEEYKRRVETMHQELLNAGMESCYKPDGGFYLFPKAPAGVDDLRLTEELANCGVLAIPGSSFGCPGYVRFAVLLPEAEIKSACAIIRKVMLVESDAHQTCAA